MELLETVGRLRELCVAVRGNHAPVDRAAAALILRFEDLLIPHFAAEEAEEFFGSLVTDRPSLLRRGARLQAEHGEMAEALACLLEFTRTGPPAVELGVRLARFLDWLDGHEHAEDALMQEFVLLLDDGEGK